MALPILGELKTLAELGITYIPLTHDGKSHRLSDGSGQRHECHGHEQRKSLTVADVALRLGTRNAALTVSPNGVNIRPGDDRCKIFTPAMEIEISHSGWEPRDTRQRFFGEMTARA